METIVLPIKELLLLGVLIEAVVQVIKPLMPQKLSEKGIQLISMALGMAFAIMLNISIFVGLEQSAMLVGSVCVGLIASRGSNFIHDFISSMKGIADTSK